MPLRAGLGVVTVAVLGGELLVASGALPRNVLIVLIAAPAAAILAWLVTGRSRRGFLGLAGALTALAVGANRMDTVLAPALPATHVALRALPERTTLVGGIVAAPVRRANGVVLVVEAESVGRGTAREPACGRVRLTVRRPARRWRYGERLEATTTLRRPRNFENPGSFDWAGHLARRDIRVIAGVWDAADVRRLPGRPRGLRARLERWRTRLGMAIERGVPAPQSGVLAALVIGDESRIAPSIRDAFTRAGVVHVLSISGLHVGLVAASAFAIARWSLARSTWLLLHTNVELLAAVVSLGPVLVYAALAGLGIATVRSAVMVAGAVLAALVGRRADVLRTLALAALGLALVWPGAPLDIAFQLSFVSVLAIVCGTDRWARSGRGRWARLRTAALVSPCALLGTAPLTAFHFHQVSVVGVFANPLVVPIFGSLAVGLGLVGAFVHLVAPSAGRVLFSLAGQVLRPGIALVEAMAAPSWAAVDVPIPSIPELLLVYAGLAGCVLLPRRGARVVLAVALVLLVADAAWWVHRRHAQSTLRVTFLDVGQGDAAVAELPGGRVIVIDAGGFPGSDFDVGAAVVGPFLWSRKILRLDALVMTHAHPDHSGGLPYLLAHHRPREFWWTGVPGDGAAWTRVVAALATSGALVRVLGDGVALGNTGAGIAVLHPPPDDVSRSLNESSLTLRVDFGAIAMLFTGDIERAAEARLGRAPGRLRAAVLKVPHHGSRTSSSPAFVDAVDPVVAVVSVGADNRYGLPAPEVEARYRQRGVCVLRTDRCGAVIVETDGRTLRVETKRPGCACPGV